ncbi:MAG: hypothetical protein J6U04_06265 [Salinivirgaceae bacterium]|nr:hypothetical protein [Salinivirgaceae bacterium]
MSKKKNKKQLGDISPEQKEQLKAKAKAAADKVKQKSADAANRALTYLNEGDNMGKVLKAAGCVGLFVFGFILGKRRGKQQS